MHATATPGVASGSTISVNDCQRVAPSTCAASSSSRGMLKKYALSSHTLNGTENIRYTAISAGSQFSMCRLLSTMKIGMNSSVDGNRYTKKTELDSIERPGYRSRDKLYA